MIRVKLHDRHTGTKTKIIVTITDADGTLVDPTYLDLDVTLPDETTASYSYSGGDITKDSTGLYHYVIEWTQAGRWHGYWTSEGTSLKDVTSWFVDVSDPIP